MINNSRYNLGFHYGKFCIFEGRFSKIYELQERPYAYVVEGDFVYENNWHNSKLVYVSKFRPIKISKAIYHYLRTLIENHDEKIKKAIEYLINKQKKTIM